MATAPARICSCGRRVPAGNRCSCQKARERERPGARQRGYDRTYQLAAAEFIRLHPHCTCGKPSVLVRHKISIAKRPDLRMDRSNWLPGCRSCNAKDMHRERREASPGWSTTSTDGAGTVRGKRARFDRKGIFGP